MFRVVLDPNVVVAAVLSGKGAPAALLRRWRAGGFELVVSEKLLTELDRALAETGRSIPVSGDGDLLELAGVFPVRPARALADTLAGTFP